MGGACARVSTQKPRQRRRRAREVGPRRRRLAGALAPWAAATASIRVRISWQARCTAAPFKSVPLEAAVAETGLRVRPDKVPKVWFLSVDPDRDADYVSEYGPFFHPDFRSMTGARDQIDTFIAATDSFYRLMPADADGEYEGQHSSAVSVIAPGGTLRAKLQPPFDPSMTAEFLARLQIGYRRELSQ